MSEHENLSTADMAFGVERKRADESDDTTRVEGEEARAESPTGESGTPAASATAETDTGRTTNEAPAALLPTDNAQDLRSRWDSIQTGFVDEPRQAVEQADGLVAEAMKRLAEVFADERGKLEGQWDRGDNISTEDLRVALQRYRSFFDRLLSV